MSSRCSRDTMSYPFTPCLSNCFNGSTHVHHSPSPSQTCFFRPRLQVRDTVRWHPKMLWCYGVIRLYEKSFGFIPKTPLFTVYQHFETILENEWLSLSLSERVSFCHGRRFTDPLLTRILVSPGGWTRAVLETSFSPSSFPRHTSKVSRGQDLSSSKRYFDYSTSSEVTESR